MVPTCFSHLLPPPPILPHSPSLRYLHEECKPAVVHRRVSSANVLLDDQLQPRVAGAGLSFLNPVGVEGIKVRGAR